jgi:hypothetical protein
VARPKLPLTSARIYRIAETSAIGEFSSLKLLAGFISVFYALPNEWSQLASVSQYPI